MNSSIAPLVEMLKCKPGTEKAAMIAAQSTSDPDEVLRAALDAGILQRDAVCYTADSSDGHAQWWAVSVRLQLTVGLYEFRHVAKGGDKDSAEAQAISALIAAIDGGELVNKGKIHFASEAFRAVDREAQMELEQA